MLYLGSTTKWVMVNGCVYGDPDGTAANLPHECSQSRGISTPCLFFTSFGFREWLMPEARLPRINALGSSVNRGYPLWLLADRTHARGTPRALQAAHAARRKKVVQISGLKLSGTFEEALNGCVSETIPTAGSDKQQRMKRAIKNGGAEQKRRFWYKANEAITIVLRIANRTRVPPPPVTMTGTRRRKLPSRSFPLIYPALRAYRKSNAPYVPHRHPRLRDSLTFAEL